MSRHETTYIPDVGHQCDNCGAYAEKIEWIEHYPTCKAGESKKWEKHANSV